MGVLVTQRFLDWAKARAAELLAPELTADTVLDERELDLGQLIAQRVNEGLGCCVVLRLPALNHDGSTHPDNVQQTLSVDIALLHNAVLAPEVDSLQLAERLYRGFSGADFELNYVGHCANVRATGFRGSVARGKKTYTFTIYFNFIL